MSAKRLVKKLSSDCRGNIELDKSVVFWSELLNKIRGQIQIQRNSTCNASGIVKGIVKIHTQKFHTDDERRVTTQIWVLLLIG